MLTRLQTRRRLSTVVVFAGLTGLALTVVALYLPVTPVLAGLLCCLPLLVVAPLSIDQAFRKVRHLAGRLGWVHVCWLLLLLSSLQFRIRGVDSIARQPLDLWALYRVGFVGLAFLLIAVWAFSMPISVREWLRGLPGWLALYAAVCLLSATWSVEPLWTLYKSAEYLTGVLILAAAVQSAVSVGRKWGRSSASTGSSEGGEGDEVRLLPAVEYYKTVLDFNWTLYAALIGTVWMGVFLWPEAAIVHGIGTVGIAINGVIPAIGWNTVGEISAVLAIVCLARVAFRPHGWSRGALYLTGLVGALATLILSASRSSVAGFLVGAGVMLIAAKRFGSLVVLICGSLIMGLQTQLGDMAVNYLLRGQSPDAFYSFSGRVQLWEYGIERLAESPLNGFGAYAGGRFVAVANYNVAARELASHVLNTFLEVLLGTSFWGLIPLLVALGGAYWLLVRHSWKAPRGSGGRALALEALGVLGVITVRSFFTVKFVWHPALLFFAVVGCAEVLRRREQLVE